VLLGQVEAHHPEDIRIVVHHQKCCGFVGRRVRRRRGTWIVLSGTIILATNSCHQNPWEACEINLTRLSDPYALGYTDPGRAVALSFAAIPPISVGHRWGNGGATGGSADEKRLVDLSPAEERGLCEWGEGVIRDKVAGRTIECNGNPIRFSGCLGASEACPATVGQWTDCIPNLLDALFADPCLVISFSFESEFQAFIDETPSCEGLGACGTVRQ
jgi:hypothetical protein